MASGAIASDYQRLRVEEVAGRLGLASLAYLWHAPQAALLRGMIDGGLQAILVKTAALGLEPARHLGLGIAALAPHLATLRDRFGCNVCGEGGEYETLTLDCPLFAHGRIVLDAWEARAPRPRLCSRRRRCCRRATARRGWGRRLGRAAGRAGRLSHTT